MRRSLVFAGKDLREFACWWDGSKVFRKPSKKVDSYGIPFRNGDLFRSQMAFNNVQIVFNCYIKTDFEKNYTNLVNYLHSFDTYQKLETTSESDVYRMAHIHEEIEPTTGQFLKDGQFTLTFDCMPQEFLKIGDDEITVQNQTPVYRGKSLQIENTGQSTVSMARIYFSPKQEGTGDPSPTNIRPITGWSGVFLFRPSGKNWLEYKGDLFPSEVDGVTFTPNAETMQITIDGRSTAEIEYMLNEEVPLAEGTYIMTGTPSFTANNAHLIMRIGDVLYDDFGEGCEFTLTESKTASVYIYVPSDYTPLNETFSPMIRLADTDPAYEPYEEGGTVWESFLSTRYGGYVDLRSGTLTVTCEYLASYNGETLPSTWISDRDVYAEGTTPTTGAKVVYKLATPQTYQLTANEIALIYGTNTFSTDADSITMRTVEPMQITNPTLMDAKPLIKINNGGSYYIDGELIIQTHGSGATYPMYIDSETMDAYAINEYGGKVSMNGYVDLTAGFILIGKGTHELYSNNANNAWAIVPRWWRL